MKRLFTLLVLGVLCNTLQAQTQMDSTNPQKPDTIRIGSYVIVKSGRKSSENNDKDKKEKNYGVYRQKRSGSNITTNWLIVDIGFANYNDKTDYNNTEGYLYNRPGIAPLGKSDFKLNTGKSVNVNIWLFMQQFNLIKHHVNLKYGVGIELNNYRYRSDISYLEKNPFEPNSTPAPVVIRDSVSFSKNKLAADYVTVPFMLNFRTGRYNNNRGLSISLGVSAGYLYSQRNKQVSKDRGKQTNRGNYDLEQFKFSYVGELGLGPVKLYGSYTPKSIYQRGMDIRPYTLGVRLSVE
ncbi:MAG: outer membrane beta-barrel protein [Ferruginibacter sp.]